MVYKTEATVHQGFTLSLPFACGLLLAGGLFAQQTVPQGSVVERVDVTVANVEVFVMDRQGNPVADLTASDFELMIDSRPVAITNFYSEVGGLPASRPGAVPATDTAAALERASAQPLTPQEQRVHLALLVDHSRLRATNRKRVLEQLTAFFESQLRAEDSVAVVSYRDRLIFHSDFLNDRPGILRVLRDVMKESFRSPINETERRRIYDELTRGRSGGFAQESARAIESSEAVLARVRGFAENEYQQGLASLRGLERLISAMSGVPGRKAILYVSDGIPNRPGEDLFVAWRNVFGGGNPQASRDVDRIDFNTDYERAIGRYDMLRDFQLVANRANGGGVTLYPIDAEGDHTTLARSAMLEVGASSEALSVIENNMREPLELSARTTGGRRIQASGNLASDLARLATDFDTYYSLGFAPQAGNSDETRRVEVRVNRPGLRVRHRESLQIRDGDERAAGVTLASLLFNANENEHHIVLQAGEAQKRDDGARILPVRVEIPLEGLALLPRGEMVSSQLSLFVTVKDKVGDARPVQKIPFYLQLPAEALPQARGESAHYTLPVVLQAGDQQVAVGVREDVSSLMSTARLELPRR